jgi:hypothetical protein
MEQQQIEQASDLILDSIINSNLDKFTKLELLINMKNFFENYNENIKLLNKETIKK